MVKVFDGKFALRKLCQSYLVYMIKVWSKFVSFDHAHFSSSCVLVYIDLDSKDVMIGQFPSKSIKVFRKIGWVSIPSKFFDKVFDAGLHDHYQRTLSKEILNKFFYGKL